MAEWLIAWALALAAYFWGRDDGRKAYERELIIEVRAGRSPKARALQAVFADDSLSSEHDR